MIVWREKIVATGIHFLVTLVLAIAAAALIFLIWFPDPLQTMIGGTELFLLVVGCDLVLGPLISLVIYNSRKSRRKLLFDYTIVGVIQIASLVYGVFVLADTRPVYVAFSVDRIEVVTARELTDVELAAARDDRYKSLPFTGPRHVATKVPPAEFNEALFQAFAGNEQHMRPRFYVPYESQLPQIRKRAKTIEELEQKHPESQPLLAAATSGIPVPASRLRWLPAHHRKGFWTALIDTDDGKPVTYVQFDPY
jgi:hypothetical protein